LLSADNINIAPLHFQHLPAFAAFLKTHHLDRYVKEQYRLAKEIQVPLLRFLQGIPEEEVLRMTALSAVEFFSHLINNKAHEYIRGTINQWLTNQMPLIKREQIVAEDITLVGYMRRETLLHFLPEYTQDPVELIALIREIDRYMLESETATTNTYISLLKEGIREQTHFKERIAETSPGVIFIYDLAQRSQVYVNEKVQEILSYTSQEILQMHEETLLRLIHPDDVYVFYEREEKSLTLKDGDIRQFEYRLKKKDGTYSWIKNYESVFKRNENNKPVQLIGIMLDIDSEKRAAEELKVSREQLLEAQELTEMGNFEWYIEEDRSIVSPQVLKILQVEPGTGFSKFLDNVHPADRGKVKAAMDVALKQTGQYDSEFRYLVNNKLKIVWSRGRVIFENDRPVRMKGTVMDVTERRHMIQRLQRSETLYKQAQALSHIGNWTLDVVLDRMTWSDELFRIFGMEPGAIEPTLDAIFEAIQPEERDTLKMGIQESLQDHHQRNFDFRVVLPRGEERFVNSRIEVITDESDNPVKILGTCQDVTQQKLADKELLENQHLIRKIADATPSIITAYNIHTGKYLFVNKAFENILGYPVKELTQKGVSFLSDLVHPDDIGPLMEKNAEVTAQANLPEYANPEHEIISEFKYRIRHQDGSYRWMHTYGTVFDRNAANEVLHVLNISADITGMVEAENKMREQEHFIERLADASPMVLYLFEVKTASIIYINKEIEKALGYSSGEITALGSSVIREIFHPDDAAEMPVRLAQYNVPGQPKSLFQFECRLKNKNGEWCWFLIREVVFRRNEDGKISQLLGAAINITMRKEMEDKLFHQTMALQQSNTSLGEFAYVASHDLKEPLRKISTFTDRLLNMETEDFSEEAKLYLNKVIESSARMQQLIDDLLSISMISSEQSFQTYSLKLVAEEVIQTLEHKIEEKKAVIKISDLPQVRIVPSQFRQLFQNLISNSLKFSKKDTQPVITITHKLLRPYELPHSNLGKASKYLEIKISDNGIGFDKVFSEKIFTIFQRLHNRSQYEGTGIGLAICRRIVENHRGVIFATGSQQEGATFTVVIPYQAA
jgi:PAS domain S-box-containing protein